MNKTLLKLVTIIAEDELEQHLVEDLKRLGASGYTVSEVRGEGLHGKRASDWEGRNIRLETIVTPDVADRIAEHVATRYFPNFAVILYTGTVEVLRPEHFV
jgi:nitrogen regulatory protein PII